MPLIKRQLLVDRPTAVDPIFGEEDEEDSESLDDVSVIGDGGGKIAHGVEFEEGHEDIIKSSNLVAVLATGQEEGELYVDVFKNAAFQLAKVDETDHTLDGLVGLSEDLDVAFLGTSDDGDTESDDVDPEEVDETDDDPDSDEDKESEEVSEDEETSEE